MCARRLEFPRVVADPLSEELKKTSRCQRIRFPGAYRPGSGRPELCRDEVETADGSQEVHHGGPLFLKQLHEVGV